jgi:hypothetical protein
MPFSLSRLRKRSDAWLLALLALNLLMLAFFLIFGYQLIFHSDAAVKNLLAQEMYETGRFFPPEWNYINNDVWVLFNHVFILALLPFARNNFALHAAASLLSAALVLLGAWKVCGLLGQSRKARLASLVLLSSGMTVMLAEHVYGQAAYGTLFYMACFMLMGYWAMVHGGGRARWGGAALLALLTVLAFWSNPQRALVFFALPLLLAGATLLLLDRQARAGADAVAAELPAARTHCYALAVLLAALVLGCVLNRYTMAHVINHKGLAAINWLDFGAMQHQLLAIVQGLLGVLGGLPEAGKPVLKAAGVYQALRLLAGVALLALLPWTLARAFQRQHRGRLFVAVFTAASLGVNLFILLTTTLADMGTTEAMISSVRYLVPSLLFLLLVFAGAIVDGKALPTFGRYAGLATIAVLATSAPGAYLNYYAMIFPAAPSMHMPTRDTRQIDFLRQNGLQYGYASYWNAGKISVLSGGDVRVRHITIENGLPVPMRGLGSNRWYERAYWTGKTFLLLGDDELKQIDLAALSARLGPPLRTLRFEEGNVLEFAGNLAALPGWDLSYRTPAVFPVNAASPHNAGQADAAGGLVAQQGEQGTLHFGPFLTVSPGDYIATFDLETSGAPDGASVGRVDVSSAAGATVHAERALTGNGRQRQSVAFTLARRTTQLELRAFVNGAGRVALRSVELARAPAASSPQTKPALAGAGQ